MSSSVFGHRKRAPIIRGAVALSLLLGCGCPGSKGRDCTIGTESCACTSASTCDPGLSCQNGSCVGPNTPPGTPVNGASGKTLEIEPFRAEGFAFASPRGFSRKTAGPGTYVFEPAPGSPAEISRFQMTYLGRMENTQAPEAGDLIFKAFEDRKLTLVGKIDYGVGYAAAVADTGKAGPGRYVLLMYLRHWDLRNEDLYNATAPRLRTGPAQVNVFTAEFAISDPAVVERNNLWYVLKSIAWGISIPQDSFTRSEVVGSWEAFLGGLPLQYEDAQGNWIGGQNEGSVFKLALDGEGNYQLSTAFSVYCTVGTICAVEGVVKANARGRFQLDGGVLTFERSGCELRIYDKNLKPTSSGACPADRVPVTLRLGRGEGGVARFSGLGSDVVNSDDQRIWNAGRKPLGNWNVTDADRAAVPAPPDAGGIAICGAVGEKEPNHGPDLATPFSLAQPMEGCFPTDDDVDYYEVTIPQGEAHGGYVELTLTNPLHGLVAEVNKASGADIYKSADATSAPGKPIALQWGSAPGQKYRVSVRTGQRSASERAPGWSKYSINATFTKVPDLNEPNETAAEAKAIVLGAPVRGYFFGRRAEPADIPDVDWYAFDVQPGSATILVDEIPANLHAYLDLVGPDGRRATFRESSRVDRSVHTPALGATLTVAQAGTHRLELNSYTVVTTESGAPVSYTKPYRVLITQP